MKDKVMLALATGGGFGLFAPFAPGTFGSIPGVALALATTLLPWYAQVPLALALALLAVPVCGWAERRFGIVDDGRITADEWMLFPLAVVGLPLAALPWWETVAFFAVVRLVDIVKPWPARGLQRLPGGWGVVADDFMANLYAWALNAGLFAVLARAL